MVQAIRLARFFVIASIYSKVCEMACTRTSLSLWHPRNLAPPKVQTEYNKHRCSRESAGLTFYDRHSGKLMEIQGTSQQMLKKISANVAWVALGLVQPNAAYFNYYLP